MSSKRTHDLSPAGIIHELSQRPGECALIVWRYIHGGLLRGDTVLGQIECDNWLRAGHVLHDLYHGGTIVVRISGVGIHADIHSGQIPPHFVAVHEAGKPHVVLETQFLRKLSQAGESVSITHEDAIKISSAESVLQMMERPQEVVDAVLKSHHANEAKKRFCLWSQSQVRLNRAATLNLDAIAYDGDAFFGHVVAFHLDVFVGLVGGDDVVGDHASKPLQCEEGSVNDRRATVRKTGTIHLWG